MTAITEVSANFARNEGMTFRTENRFNHHGNIDIIKRLGLILASLDQNSTLINVGITGLDQQIVEKKYQQQISDKGITIETISKIADVLPFKDKSITAVFGNLHGGKELNMQLTEMSRVLVPQGDFILNIYKGASQNGDFDSEALLSEQFTQANFLVQGASKDDSGWWRIEGFRMPDEIGMAQLTSQPGRPRIYGGEFYSGEVQY